MRPAVGEKTGQDEGLLGVIGDAARRHGGGDGLLGDGVVQPGDRAVVPAYLCRAHGLGGHAQCVTKSQSGQRPQGGRQPHHGEEAVGEQTRG